MHTRLALIQKVKSLDSEERSRYSSLSTRLNLKGSFSANLIFSLSGQIRVCSLSFKKFFRTVQDKSLARLINWQNNLVVDQELKLVITNQDCIESYRTWQCCLERSEHIN